MTGLEKYKQTFFDECEDRLADLDAALAALEDDTARNDALYEAFRAVHSIKGGGAAFGFEALVQFSHSFESALDVLASKKDKLDRQKVGVMIRAADLLRVLIDAARCDRHVDVSDWHDVAGALESLCGGSAAPSPEEDLGAPAAVAELPDGGRAPCVYRIYFKPYAGIFRRAIDPLAIIGELKELGDLSIEADMADLPGLADLDPKASHLGWTLTLCTVHGQDDVAAAFEFVEGDCEMSIERVETAPAVAPGGVPDGAPGGTADRGDAVAGFLTSRMASIRVSLDRVDHLVNMVGEIVIAQAMLTQKFKETAGGSFPELVDGLEQFAGHTRNLQDAVMAIRAQPVGTMFARMPRLVRELCEVTGKNVELLVAGEATEIDKTVIEELADPLVHMIRNAVDHGIEPPDERKLAGKPAAGTIKLGAEQSGSRITISISDDGRGIDRDAVLRKAIGLGLISPASELSGTAIDNLILTPGFSTAASVSDVSGRGVGMDIVHTNVKRLGGRMNIRSEPGVGTDIQLTLPLTLAVLDGMVVRIGTDSYVLPILSIVETLSPRAVRINSIAGSSDVLKFRGEYIAVVDMHKLFGQCASGGGEDRLAIVTETEGAGLLALMVDQIIGQQQVVIKRLDHKLADVPGISGATILGDGNVALILDPAAISDVLGPSGTAPDFDGPGPGYIQEMVA